MDGLVQDAVNKGAKVWRKRKDKAVLFSSLLWQKVLAGGKKNAAFESGRFYEPTLLVNVTHDMEVRPEASFVFCFESL